MCTYTHDVRTCIHDKVQISMVSLQILNILNISQNTSQCHTLQWRLRIGSGSASSCGPHSGVLRGSIAAKCCKLLPSSMLSVTYHNETCMWAPIYIANGHSYCFIISWSCLRCERACTWPCCKSSGWVEVITAPSKILSSSRPADCCSRSSHLTCGDMVAVVQETSYPCQDPSESLW